MLKLLLKNQFLSFFSVFTKSKKKKRSYLSIALLGVLILSILAFAIYYIYYVCEILSFSLKPLKLNWTYFAVIGLISLLIDVMISIFSTYNVIYASKDNDLLLSMPIKPKNIFISRLLACYVFNFALTFITYLPALIYYFVNFEYNALSVIFSVLNMFLLPIISLLICIIIGYVIALIAPHIKRKNLAFSLLSITFSALVYIVYYYMANYLEDLLLRPLKLCKGLKKYLYPIYIMGKACSGKILPILSYFSILVGISTIFIFLFSRVYLGLITVKKGFKQTKYKGVFNYRPKNKALFIKEVYRFFGTPIYWINSSFGTIALIGLTCAGLFMSNFNSLFNTLYPGLEEIKSLIILIPVVFLVSTNLVSACSINIEGKNLWISQSLPIKVTDIFKSKLRLHVLISLPASIICLLALNIKLGSTWYMTILSLTFITTFIFMSGLLGLVINLWLPKLDWSNTTQATKQSFSLFIELMILFVIIGLSIFVCIKLVTIYWLFLLILTLSLQLANVLLLIYLKTKGVKKYTCLN